MHRPTLFDPKGFVDGIYRIAVEGRLELREELPWNGLNGPDACHWQENPLGAAVECHLETFCKVLRGDDIARQDSCRRARSSGLEAVSP